MSGDAYCVHRRPSCSRLLHLTRIIIKKYTHIIHNSVVCNQEFCLVSYQAVYIYNVEFTPCFILECWSIVAFENVWCVIQSSDRHFPELGAVVDPGRPGPAAGQGSSKGSVVCRRASGSIGGRLGCQLRNTAIQQAFGPGMFTSQFQCDNFRVVIDQPLSM